MLLLVFNQLNMRQCNYREDNTVLYCFEATCMPYQQMSHWEEVIWKYHFIWKHIQTCRSYYALQISSASLSCSSSPPLLVSFSFPPQVLPVSSIMHVFTSKVIVPDLYDRPLTLRVLVHQHQAEKHPRACVSRTKSGSLSFSTCNLQLECTPTNHIYSSPVRRCESITQGEKCWKYVSKYISFSCQQNRFELCIFVCIHSGYVNELNTDWQWLAAWIKP